MRTPLADLTRAVIAWFRERAERFGLSADAIEARYILNWDDLAVGDPALEYAIFLGPLWRDGILSPAEVEDLLPAGADLRERFRMCLRAFLLDEVIDTLADWVECAFAREHQGQVRADKERAHREALATYLKIYD